MNGSANGAILETEAIVAGYLPEVDILNGVSIRVGEGEIVTVIGPNGAGKSTLIKTIFGLLRPREGRVVFRYLEGHNPNGAARRIAGVCNAARNVVGLMPHPEHAVDPLTGSDDGMCLFASVAAHREALGARR